MKLSIAIAGCGKVGTTLGHHLQRKNFVLQGIACRSAASAEKAAQILNVHHHSVNPWDVTGSADIVFITTPDDAIADTCKAIADHNGFKKNAFVLHCSGSLPSTILAPARKCGAITGSLHPLQSFAQTTVNDNPFQGIIMAAEGDPEAVALSRQIADTLAAVFIEIKTDAKTLYHASAVVASNYLVSLIGFAFDLIEEAGISSKDAMMVLNPLIMGTLNNIDRVGVVKALTGPIVRGDAATIQNHLKKITEARPDLVSMYKVLGQYALSLTEKKGSLDPKRIEALSTLLN